MWLDNCREKMKWLRRKYSTETDDGSAVTQASLGNANWDERQRQTKTKEIILKF